MDFSNRHKLVMDLKGDLFLPPYNQDLFNKCTEDQQKCYIQVSEAFKQQKANPDLQDDIQPYIALKLKDMERTKRVQVAYLMHRINKIQSQYFVDSGRISEEHKQQLGEKEKEYLKKFDELMRGYEKLTDAKITENESPPNEVFIEVRVKKQIGEIITQDGVTLDLQTGTQVMVKKSDILKFLLDGSVIQI